MFVTFKDDICKELGSLDPNWFEKLSIEVSSNDGGGFVQDNLKTVNEAGSSKTPFEKSLVESQFSTPKIFRQKRVSSPETEDEESFCSDQEKETATLAAATSLSLFRTSKSGVRITKSYEEPQESLELFDTPKHSFSQYIAERLGADINPDVSWTSSLNTPVSTTLILNRAEDRPCPVSPIAGKHVFTVRKLFPSLSNTSRIADPSLEKSDEPTIQQAVDCLHPGHSRRSLDPLQSPLDQNDSSWRQTLPDATGNGEICITEASVLAGTENVPSIFFTKSSSTLRRVKTKDRIKRKQNILTKEKNDCSLNVTTKNVDSGGRIGDEEHREVPSSPHIGSKDNTEGIAVTHWSLLRSSNISQCDLETSCNVYDPTKRLEPNLKTDQPTCEGDPHQLTSPSVKISDSTFTKKTRFVYTVESPSPRLNGKNMLTENLQSILNPVSGQECNVKQSEKASDEVQRHHVNEKMCNRGNKSSQQGNGAEKTLVSSLPSEGQDLDMSQLCRAFAQDITQISDVSTSEEHTAEDFFSPSVCLSAMKQRNKKLLNKQKSFQRVTNLQLDCNVISNKGHVTAPQPKSSNLESTVSEFQSTAVVTHITSSSPVLSTEKDTESKPSSDCKTEISEVTLLQMSTKDKGSTHLNDIMEENVADVYLSCSIGKQSQMLGPGAGSNPYLEKTPKAPHPPVSATAIVNGKRAEHNSRVHIGDPQQITVHSPSLCVSGLDSLDKTKCLLKEIGGESPLGAQHAKCIRNTKKDTGMTHDKSAENMLTNLTNPHSSKEGGDVQCTLTASQQADVTELCRFLEEAGSEFLLTQFKPEKPKLQSPDTIPHPQGVDKELDHDFLTVADFDDSFSTDAGEQLAEMMASDKMTLPPQNNKNSKTPTNISKSADTSPFNGGGFKNPLAFLDAVSVLGDTSLTEKPLSASLCKTSRNVDSSVIGQLSSNSGFCTASGKKVHVFDDALKKAKYLWKECDAFRDNSILGASILASPAQAPHRQNGGFQTASGKGVEISVTALQKGRALFSDKKLDLDILTDIDFKESFSSDAGKYFAKTMSDKMTVPSQNKNCMTLTNLSLCSAMQKENASAGDVCSISNLPSECITGVESSEPTDSFAKNGHPETHNKLEEKKEFISDIGFKTAGGDALRVSENCLTKARASFADLEECPVNFSDKPAKTLPDKQRVIGQLSNNSGFCTAKGKRVSVSKDALKKARPLWKEFDAFEDNKQKNESLGPSHPTNPNLCPPRQNEGFKTASGKGVAISVTALQKGKALFSNCDIDENKKGVTTHPKFPFHQTSPVAFSAEPSQKGVSVFMDINTEIPVAAEVKDRILMDVEPGDAQNNREIIGCTFQTTRGIEVHVLERNLLKTKKLLNELPDGEYANSPTTLRPYSGRSFDVNRSDLAQVKTLETLNLNSDLKSIDGEKPQIQETSPRVMKSLPCLPKTNCARDGEKALEKVDVISCCAVIAKNNGMLLSENVSKETFDLKEGSVKLSREKDLHQCPAKKKPVSVSASICNHLVPVGVGGPQDNGMSQTQTSSCDMNNFLRTDKSSMLSFGSFGLGGVTVTQQQYFAQEAMDCTKALLEDENLGDYSIAMASDRMPTQGNTDREKGSVETEERVRKRRVEDDDVTDQPPLKRLLLANSTRRSALLPVKSCVQGVLHKRNISKYSVPLPNISGPYNNEKTNIDTRAQKTELLLAIPHLFRGKGRTPNPKMASFVPSLQKNTKMATPKISIPQDKGRTSAVFVPPFKKQRTCVPVTSASPLTKKDYLPHLSETPNKTNTYVSPTIKTKSPTQIIGGNRDEKIQEWNAEPTKSDVKSGPNHSFDHGTEDFNAKKSDAEHMLLGSHDIFQDLQSLQLAQDMQDMRIQKKRRQTIRPLPGNFFLAKTSGVERIHLMDAVNKQPPTKHTKKQLYEYGVHQHVSDITSENAESFRFNCQQFFKLEALTDRGVVQLADGGWLISRNDGTMGKEEFYKALCDTPGVDPKLISQEWVYNHYRWIVWKQASMERCFPATLGGLCLTPEQILLQLKYRYDVEVDHSRRPALRKIMERDDTAAKTIVLCVCGVVSWGQDPTTQTPRAVDTKVESPVGIIMLTDGWYSIKAQLDVPLTAMLHKGRLAIGGKLIIHGAELVGSQDACSPLEAPEALMLKICANSARPARWNTKLGFHRDPRPFLLPVSSLYDTGGPVGCVDIVVLRSYPIQWMEKKPDGGFVFRCTRAEEREARRYDDSKQKAMELLFAKIQAVVEKEEKDTNKPRGQRRSLSHQDIKSLQDGEELHQAIENDPVYVEAHLSEQQLETLHTYAHTLAEKRQAELQERYRCAFENAQEDPGSCLKRKVTPVWRLSIVDSRDQLSSNVYLLNIWRPSADLQSLLKEGGRYRVYNLTTSKGNKLTVASALHLTATKKTQFQDVQTTQEWLSLHFQPRISINLRDLRNPEFHPVCGEVDLVGYVISIIDGQGSSPAFYLADGDLNFVKVRCFNPLSQYCLEDLVKPFALLALSNLQLRACSSLIPVLYAGDRVLISSNPKEVHLQESLTHLRNLVQGQVNFFKTAEERLLNFSQCDRLSSTSPALQPKTPVCRTDGGHNVKTCVPSRQSFRSFGSVTLSSRDTPPANSSIDTDHKSLKRRRALDFLSRIPSPPPLSSLATVHCPRLKKKFNHPRKSCKPSTLKTVQTPVCKTVDSPVDQWVNDEELAMIDTQALHGEN